MKIIQPSATLEFITPAAIKLIERAGRTCYKSEGAITDDSAKSFVKKLKNMGHLSVFEHAHASFRVICDRGVSHEIVRHRIASYSQESTRYCNYGKGKFNAEVTFIQPIDLTDDQASFWRHAMEQAERSYLDMLAAGAPPQIARSVLPNSLKTELVWTANFREWMQVILPQRAQKPAHPQMVEIVGGFIRPALIEACPEVFDESNH